MSVQVAHSGLARLESPEFVYARPWSEASSWGPSNGQVPLEGDDVTIPAGHSVLLDVSPPPLGVLRVFGRLIVADTQVNRDCLVTESASGLGVALNSQPMNQLIT